MILWGLPIREVLLAVNPALYIYLAYQALWFSHLSRLWASDQITNQATECTWGTGRPGGPAGVGPFQDQLSSVAFFKFSMRTSSRSASSIDHSIVA